MSDVITGQTFGHLTVIEAGLHRYRPHTASGGRIKAEKAAMVRCDCGRTYEALVKNLTSPSGAESCRSCRASKRDTLKALALAYENIKRRTENPAHEHYSSYGGRGIRLFEPWRINKSRFIEEAYLILGDRPQGHSLDRINVDGNYDPFNLRWADSATQSRNRRDRPRKTRGTGRPTGRPPKNAVLSDDGKRWVRL